MPAVLHPVPAPPENIEIRATGRPTDSLYVVMCERCRWAPDQVPLFEAPARIAAYEHNAARHPDANVEVLTSGQVHAWATRRFRRNIRFTCAATAGMPLVQTMMLLVVGVDWFTIFSVGIWTALAALYGTWIGRDQRRLEEHRAHPPGAIGFVITPPDDEDEINGE